jgi:hypothetical protein
MLIGDDDGGAPNRVTMLVSHRAVARGSQPANVPQLAQDKRPACTSGDDEPMTAMLLPQLQTRSSRTCWPINGDAGGDGSNRSSWISICSSLWRRGAVSATRRTFPSPLVQPGSGGGDRTRTDAVDWRVGPNRASLPPPKAKDANAALAGGVSHQVVARDACQSAFAPTVIPILRADSRVIVGPLPDFRRRRPVAGLIAFNAHHCAKVSTRNYLSSTSRSWAGSDRRRCAARRSAS